MEEVTLFALAAGVFAAISSATTALLSFLASRRAGQVEIRFPDGHRHRIANGITHAELNRELAVVQQEISDAVVERPAE